MSVKIKAHILCHSLNGDICEPEMFPTKALAYSAMETAFYKSLRDNDCDIGDATDIYHDEAKRSTFNDDEFWAITEKELEIDDLQGLASVFEDCLSGFVNGQFAQFVAKAPHSLKLADELLTCLMELKTIMAVALPETVCMEGEKS